MDAWLVVSAASTHSPSSFTFTEEDLMTVPTNHLIRFFAAVAVGVMAAPASVLAAPVAAADDVVANDLNAEGDDDEDDCDDDNDDCDAEAHVDGAAAGRSRRTSARASAACCAPSACSAGSCAAVAPE